MPTPAPTILAPEIHADLQRIVDLMARLVTVPVGLINRRDGDELEVGIAGSDPGNPFAAGRRSELAAPGVYCETVIRTGEMLRVPNALRVSPWSAAPGFVPEMVSYLGYPIRVPDGSVYGTLCVMDRKERDYTPDEVELVEQMRNLVERHLALAWLNTGLGDRGRDLGDYGREIADLRRLIPICCSCKSVRDDGGYWQAVESWFAGRSGASFTHGICPECVQKLYPELAEPGERG